MLGPASVILDDRGRVLLVKHSYGELNWQIPGGRGEPGESAEETARREAADHHFVFRARAVGEPRVADADEITDATAGGPAGVWKIGPRVWLR